MEEDEEVLAVRNEKELAVKVFNVHKNYGSQKVLKGINMDVPYHSIYALLGASGCGKTTLLRCCLGFLKFKGRIVVMGKYPGVRGNTVPGKDLGYMPQDLGLVGTFSIFETMCYFGVMFKMGYREIRQRAEFLVNLLELPPLHQRISNMSGGEQRRVSFAVSLIQKPPLMILDEPTVGMDSLLRQNVWQYIGELTSAKECTVVITTHYIDEARRAQRVGLMREGVLLTQASPEELMQHYNAVTLEEVFIKLAYQQVEEEDHFTLNPSKRLDRSKSIQSIDSVLEERFPKETLPCHDKYFPRYMWGISPAIILAVFIKTILQTMRSIVAAILLVSLPFGNVTLMLLVFGQDIQDVKVYYHNADNATGNSTQFGTMFMAQAANSEQFNLKSTNSYESIKEKVSDGDTYVGFDIGQDFSDSLLTRYPMYCRAFRQDDNDGYPSQELIDNATVHLAVDTTNNQLFTQVVLRLTAIGYNVLDALYMEQFNATVQELNRPPVNLTEQVYGSVDWEFIDFAGIGAIALVLFVTSGSLTAMNFVLERKEGLFERAYAAGGSVCDFMMAFTMFASVIIFLQVTLLIVIAFVIFEVENEGNIFLYGLIICLSAMCGSALGLLISSLVSDEISTQNLTQMMTGLITFVSGALWPLNGQPAVMRAVTNYLPLAKPLTAAVSIVSKDLGLGDEPVYLGFITIVIWIVVIYIGAIAFFQR